MKRGTYRFVLVIALIAVGVEVFAASRGTQSLRNELQAQSFPQVRVKSVPARVRVANPEDAVVATENMTDLEIPMRSDEGAINVVSAQPVSQTVEIQALSQPTTVIEDSPVVDSRAERMRKRRQIIEEQTEQKMVERIEVERMKAEEARAEKIMKSLDPGDGSQTVQAPQVVQTVVAPSAAPVTTVEATAVVAQPTVIATAPTVVIPAPEAASVSTSLDEATETPEENSSDYFFGISGGISEYPSLSYVRGVYSLGATGGWRFSDGFIFEGTYVYSSYDLVNQITMPGMSPTVQLDQMNFILNLKYQLMREARIRPIFGVTAAYVYRNYTESNYYQSIQTRKSYALDVGLTGGFDVMVTKTFSIGLDFRYMFNVSNTTAHVNNGPSYGSAYLQMNGLENMSYYIASILSKYTF